MRLATADWFGNYTSHWRTVLPGLEEATVPVLYELATRYPDVRVRQAAAWALGSIGAYSDDIFVLMSRLLEHGELAERRAAIAWFRKNNLVPEKVVPVLVKGLEDDSMRSIYAKALIAYGPKAHFALESLVQLAKTNDRATASVASWALYAIDPKMSADSGVGQ